MENILIRNIKTEDIPQVVDIQISGWRAAYKGIVDDEYLNSMDREEKIKKRQNDYKFTDFIVAELNNEIVGFCRYIDSTCFSSEIKDADCELLALYVRPDLKNNGIGTKLFQYVKNEFTKIGKSKMIIWCLKDNESAKKFYKKMNGKIICERQFSIGNKSYPEVCFLYDI